LGKLQALGEVTHPLQPEPERLHPGLAVALAPEKAAKSGDQPDDGVELGGLLGRTFLGPDLEKLSRAAVCAFSNISVCGDGALNQRSRHEVQFLDVTSQR